MDGRARAARVGALFFLGVMGWAGVAVALDEAAAQTVVEGRLGAVRACLSSAEGDTHGGITLTALLTGTGTVRQVDVTRRGPHISADVARCAAAAIREATFEGGRRSDVLTIRLLVAESGASGERVRVRDVTVGGAGSGSAAP